MKKYLDKLPKDIRELIYLARDVAVAKKVRAFLVGGFVRDFILNVPNYDLDIVIQGNGLKFASALSRRLNAKLVTHPRFGTATLITPEKLKLDIATARSEVYPEPAALPVVSPGGIRQDLARRDFTINVLAVDLLAEKFGSLVDFYQGRQDLESGIIRILHNLSFIDDPTRIIRAVRFEQRLKFRIEPHSLKLLKEAVRSRMLKRVSPHRLRDELILILKEPVAIKCIRRLEKLAGLDFIHPRLKLNKTAFKLLTVIRQQINWFNSNFPEYRIADAWLVYFAGLINSLDKQQINQICGRFGLSREQIRSVISCKTFSPQKLLRLSKKDILPSRAYRDLKPLSPEAILFIKAGYGNRFLNLNIERFFKHYNRMRPYVRGDDLASLGLKPGPDYKNILEKLFYLQIDGMINSKQEALEWVKKRQKFYARCHSRESMP